MKYYTVDDDRRLVAVVVISVTCALFFEFIQEYFSYINVFIVEPLKLDDDFWALRVMAIVFSLGFLWTLNRWIWCWPVVNGLLRVPNLNGIWIGTINRTQFPDMTEEKNVPVLVHIKQEWFRISYRLEQMMDQTLSANTSSVSSSLSIYGNADVGYQLTEAFQMPQLYGVSRMELTKQDDGDALIGEYISSFPRRGEIKVRRINNKTHFVRSTIQKFTSRTGEEYLAVPVQPMLVSPFHRKLMSAVGRTKYAALARNRQDRDGTPYHITVISPSEYQNASMNDLKKWIDVKIAYEIRELGMNQRGVAESWFVIINSPHIQFVRDKIDLPAKDLHITIGFDPHDIHDCPKDATTLYVPNPV